MGGSIPATDRFSGCLIGQCLGDALGFPVEGCTPAVCDEYVWGCLKPIGLDREAALPAAIGQYTDDSQLARELIQSYVERGCFDPGDYAQRIAAIFREGRIVGRGRSTEEAAERLSQGVPWTQAGTPAPAAGNGSAMRAAPVGLIFWDDAQRMIAAAHDQGRITHQDPRCSAGAVAVSGAVALGLQGDAEVSAWTRQLSGWVADLDPVLADGIERLPDLVDAQPKQALSVISALGRSADYDNGWEGISPFVTSSVLWSLYSFFRHPQDYWATLCTAIAVGGDVDTTAAMAGAISGAYLGLDALPSDLAARLTDRGSWRLTELVELADRCHAIKHGF
ncbi:MAG TPA: ADP-ribosylglycohydrolase family protein [Burkholderiales bacterium]|nr:ADP-ribosylglycohydrolase family protein [Burkholderiales bacterium]